jgi:pimeloyl-ACP methyl ester carboxylesterase
LLLLGGALGCRKPITEVPQGELLAQAVRAAAEKRCAPRGEGTLQDVVGTPASPYFIHHPEQPTDDTPTVIFLPGGAGTRTIARDFIWKNWLSRGRRLDQVRVVIPYVSDGSRMTREEAGRTLRIFEEVLACYGGSRKRVHLAGTSNGGRHAYDLMVTAPGRFASLLGAPGIFADGADDKQLTMALRDRPVYNGVGADDADWKPQVQATHERLERLGLRSVYVEFPGQGHIVNEQFDPSGFFDFWLDGPPPAEKK